MAPLQGNQLFLKILPFMISSPPSPEAFIQTGSSNTRSECQSTQNPFEFDIGAPVSPEVNAIVQCLKVRSAIPVSDEVHSSLDWLVVSGKHSKESFESLLAFIESFGDVWVLEPGVGFSSGRGCRKFDNSGVTVLGCRLGWSVYEDGFYYSWLSIPGGFLRRLSGRQSHRLCFRLLNDWNMNCKRFDAAVDDYQRRVSFGQVMEACITGNVALVEKFSFIISGSIGGALGITVYLGSRQSEKFVRFYDAEQRRGTPCDRWEVELKRRHAHQAFEQFASLEFADDSDQAFEEIASVTLAGFVFGAVDFVDRLDGHRYSRCNRLDFWRSLVDEIGGSGIRLSPSRSQPALHKSLAWITRQVSVLLSALRSGWGIPKFHGWLASEMRAAVPRQSNYHKAVIEFLKTHECFSPT
jgi:hypothetical protein